MLLKVTLLFTRMYFKKIINIVFLIQRREVVMNISEKIKKIRNSENLTQEQFAEKYLYQEMQLQNGRLIEDILIFKI